MPSIEELNRVWLQDGASTSTDGSRSPSSASFGGVAIIGMGCRLPGSATNPSAFWDMLLAKETAAGKIPLNRFDVDKFLHPQRGRPGSMTTAGGYMLRDDPRLFEPQLFSMKPTETAEIDPALKKLLEVVYETIESAGISMEKLAGSDTGCYIGSFNHDELFSKVRDSQFAGPYTATAAIAPFLANRISYTFDLRGPSMTVDTACSASLYALHLACQAINTGEIESAIVASSNLIWSPDMQMFLDKLGALSSTSQCHVFGSDADGYGRGDGFVGFYLKDLNCAIRDNDNIQAVIRGTAANANGRTGGITHPSPTAQEAAMRKAYQMAGNLNPRDTAYYECHGTGTAVGDPIELKAIQSFFFARDKENPLLLGSVKANIGHGEPVSGLSGLLKVVLAIQRGVIPPMITSASINPLLNLDMSRFRLVQEQLPWPVNLPRRASVATSGFGGANAHVIVEEFVSNGGHTEVDRNIRPSRFLLPFSAHKPQSLLQNYEALAAACDQYSYSPMDVAYTLGRRSRLPYRGFAVISANPETSLTLPSDQLQIAKRLRTTPPRIGFIFTGQGAQWPQMGKELFGRWPAFQRAIRRMNETLQRLPDGPAWTLEEILLAPADKSQVYVAEVSQPVCAAVQIGLIEVLNSWDIVPFACMGHSSGEMAAAYAAGRVTLEEAIIAAYYRGKSVARITREGSMAALGLTPKDCEALLEPLKGRVSIAAINSPESITVSGDTDAIHEVSNICNNKGIFNRVLSTGGKAYHSFHMQEIGGIFETSTRQATSHLYQEEEERRAVKPFFSSVSGHRLPEGSPITPSYWRSNLEGPVLFSPALEELVNNGIDVLVEIGPHSALAGPIRQLEQAFRGKEKVFPPYMPTLVRKRDAEECMLELAGALFNDACELNIGAVNCAVEAKTGKKIKPRLLSSLPTYRYAYGDSLQHMSRIETEFRFPQFPFHNLLGSRVLGASPRAPSWRNVISLDSPQEVGGLRILQNAQVPVACLLEMVLVAAQQTVPSISAKTWTLTNIQLPNALTLEVERDVVTCLHPDVDGGSFFFEITSIQGREATLHAAGRIHVKEDQPIQASIYDGRVTPITIPAATLYKKLEATGLQYDVSWQSIDTVHANPLENVYRCELRETPLGRLGTLETCIQLAIMSSVTHQQPRDPQLAYPVSIGKVDITGSWDNLDLSAPYLASTHQSGDFVKTVDLWDTNSQLAICLKDVRLSSLDRRIIKTTEYPALWSISKPDYTTISQSSISGMFPAPDFPGEKTFSKVHKLASAMVVQYISSQTDSSSSKTSKSLSETGQNFLEWLENAYAQIPNGSIPYGQELTAMDGPSRSKLISTLYEEVSQDSVEAQLMMRMYTNLSGVLDGTISAHDLLMVDGLLHKLYTSTFTAAGSMIQLRRVIDLVGHKDPSARYLEIGGGTRGATREILDVLGAWSGGRRYGSYCFTDVSSYFLSGARDEFQECQDISYATLNIEEAPSKQGVEEGSYDVVVAANVLHATTSLEETLLNVRRLLKPNGKLILVETTIETVWLTIVLGGFSDYWKGRRDGRPTSPFISVDLWNQALQKCGFTGAWIDLPDYADPFTTMNVLVSSVADDSLNGQAASADPDKGLIERFYPMTPSKHIESATLNAESNSSSVVLIDCINEPFFANLTTWLVETGIRSIIIARSVSVSTKDGLIDGSVLLHLESLRQLGIAVSVVWEPLSIQHQNRVSMQLRATLSPRVKAVVFGRPEAGIVMEDLHVVAQHVFSGRWAPEKVLIITSADESFFSQPASRSEQARRIADSWAKQGPASSLLTLFQDQPIFDDLIPGIEGLFCNSNALASDSVQLRCAQSIVSGLSPENASTRIHERQTEVPSQTLDKFAIILQTAAAQAQFASANTINGQAATPTSTAVAKFRSIPVEDADKRRNAAADAVAEVLAELLFIPKEQISMQASVARIGIDSLIASELRKQVDELFEKRISTGWLLSGEVKVADIVDVVLES